MRTLPVDASEVRMASKSGKGVRSGSKRAKRPSSGREARVPTTGGRSEGATESRRRDAFPMYPMDPANPSEQESILSQGEEARPRKVRGQARGEIDTSEGMRASTVDGSDPDDDDVRGGVAFADAPKPLLKPLASARPRVATHSRHRR